MRAGALLCLGLLAGCAREAERPDVLLITLDTVRADALSCSGGRPGCTPNIDALAAQGVLFSDAWTPRGQTWPALASLLSGRLPIVHGVRENGFELPPNVAGLPEHLRRAGYTSAAFLANACEAWGMQRFDLLACARPAGEEFGDQVALQRDWDARAVAQALEWWGAESGPRFAWVHLYDAHKPYPTHEFDDSGRALRERFLDPQYRGPWRAGKQEVAHGDRTPWHERVDAAALAGELPASAELAALRAYYDAGVASVDERVGQLLAGIDREHTLVLLTADHGEELFEHANYPYHGASLHSSTLRVPLLIAWPARIPAGSVCASPAALIDVFPTLLELLDLPAAERIDGRSLLPAIDGQTLPARAFLTEVTEYDLYQRPARLVGEVFGIEREGWRLVWNPQEIAVHKSPFGDRPGAGPGVLHPSALFELASDPYEQHNLLEQQAARASALQRELEQLLAELAPRAIQAGPPSADVLESLRGLGYLGEER